MAVVRRSPLLRPMFRYAVARRIARSGWRGCMQHLFCRLSAAGLIAAILFSSGAASAETLRILLASDVYKMGAEDGRGGHAKLAAVVEAERTKGGTFLYAFAGDAISPCLMCGFDKGEHLITLLNMMPPDVFVPGNHEFDFGKAVFLQRMKQAAFPIHAANLSSADGSAESLLTASRIIGVGAARIGIVGVTADDSPVKSTPEDLQFASGVETLTREAAQLRRNGADLVIGVVHAGRTQDLEMLRTRAVDVLLSGDDHDYLWSYDGQTVFVEGGEDAQRLSVLELDINITNEDGKGRRVNWEPALRMIDTKAIIPHPDVAQRVAAFEAELSKELDVSVGTVAVAFDSASATVRSRENYLGNLVADALLAGYGGEVALFNGGGLRGNKTYRPGDTFTRRDVLSELPFANKAVMLELSGRDLRALLEHGLGKLPELSGRFPCIAGARLRYDGSRPVGSRIVEISVGGQPVSDTRIYKVVTNDFLLRGGDGYPFPKDARLLVRPEDGRLVSNEVLAFLRKNGMERVTVGDRVLAVPAP